MPLPTNVANELDAITGEVDPGFKPTGEGYHAKLHNDANEEINEIKAELGSNPSGSEADVAARLAAMNLVLATHTEGLSTAGAAIAAEAARAEAAEAGKASLSHASRHQLGGADPLALQQYDRDLKLPGIFAPNNGLPSTTANMTSSRAYFCRFVPSRKMVIKSIRFALTATGGTTHAVAVGIYNSTLSERLAVSKTETVNTEAVGVKALELTATFEVQPDTVYFAALSWGTVTGTPALAALLNNNGLYGDIFGTGTMANRSMLFLNSGHPLGTGPITPTGSAVNPWLVVSEV